MAQEAKKEVVGNAGEVDRGGARTPLEHPLYILVIWEVLEVMKPGIDPGTGGSTGAGGSAATETPSARQIAHELVSPTTLTHLFSLTDSRLFRKQSNLLTNCEQIGWGGTEVLSQTALPVSGVHAVTSLAPSAADPTPSFLIASDINAYSPGPVREVEFLGANEPAVGDNSLLSRIAGGSFSRSDFPLLWARLEKGGDVQIRQPFWRTPIGMSGAPGVFLQRYATGTTFSSPGNVSGDTIWKATGEGYGEMRLEVPDGYDWGTFDSGGLNTIATPGGTTTPGEGLLLLNPWVQATDGIVLHPWGIGGRTLSQFLQESLFSDRMYTELMPFIAGADEAMLWIDLGTNGTEGVGQAEHEAMLEQLIGKFRRGNPKGTVMLTTAYPSHTDQETCYYQQAALSVEASIPGTAAFDTFANMPLAIIALRLGYYGGGAELAVDGAQTMGTGSLVLSSIPPKTAASGRAYVWNGKAFDAVAYSSWDQNTLSLKGTLPSDVADGAPVMVGDLVHYSELGDKEWARTLGDLIAREAGVSHDLVNVANDKALVLALARHSTLTENGGLRLGDRLGGNHYEAPSAVLSPKHMVEASLNDQPCLHFDGSTYVEHIGPNTTYRPLHAGEGRVVMWLVVEPDQSLEGNAGVVFATTDNSSSPGLALSFEKNNDLVVHLRNDSQDFSVVMSENFEAQLVVVDIDFDRGTMVVDRYFSKGRSDLSNTAEIAAPSILDPAYPARIGLDVEGTKGFIGRYGGHLIVIEPEESQKVALTERLREKFGLD